MQNAKQQITCLLIAVASCFMFSVNEANAQDFDVICAAVYQPLDADCRVEGEQVLGGLCLAQQIISCLRAKEKDSTSELINSYSELSTSLGICEENLKKSKKQIRRLKNSK